MWGIDVFLVPMGFSRYPSLPSGFIPFKESLALARNIVVFEVNFDKKNDYVNNRVPICHTGLLNGLKEDQHYSNPEPWVLPIRMSEFTPSFSKWLQTYRPAVSQFFCLMEPILCRNVCGELFNMPRTRIYCSQSI